MPNEMIQLYGLIKPHSLKWSCERATYQFGLTDLKSDVNVSYQPVGGVPYEFKEGESVVLWGYYRKKKCEFIGTGVQTNHSTEEQNWDQKKDYKNKDY